MISQWRRSALAQARRFGQGRALTIGHGTLAWFLTDRGDLDRAEDHLGQAKQTIDLMGGDRALHFIRIPEALLALERGDADSARMAAANLPLPKGRTILADAHLLACETEPARVIGRRLVEAGPPGSYAVALGERVLGLVAQAEEGPAGGRDLLARSAGALESLGLPFDAGISHFHLGTAESLRSALAVFEALGADRWADRARRSLRALGIRVQSPRRRFPDPGGDAAQPPGTRGRPTRGRWVLQRRDRRSPGPVSPHG